MKRSIVAITLAVVFVMALAAPAFAMTHTATYEMDGVIDFKKQSGHLCNTGAEHKQTISGDGVMSKEMSVVMSPGIITVEDTNDYVAGETGLEVTSVIELCAPPKYMYEDEDGYDAVVSPYAMYGHGDQPYTFGPHEFGEDGSETYEMWSEDWEALTNQIWAVQVAADPGYSGNLHQDFVAAYGPYSGLDNDNFDADGNWNVDDKWGWDGSDAVVGTDYVGNYFNIDQSARTSQGTLQRFIDVSSPWNHGYLMEDMSVVGQSEIDEAFTMDNLPAGEDTEVDWWVLF